MAVNEPRLVANDVVEFRRLTVGISLTQEMFSQGNYVFVPITKRRQLADETGDPIVKVSTKRAMADEVAEVPIGRANQSEFASTPCAASQALISAFLDYAKQLRLQRQWQFADFIQKQSSTIR
jgi:hypothetical protein